MSIIKDRLQSLKHGINKPTTLTKERVISDISNIQKVLYDPDNMHYHLVTNINTSDLTPNDVKIWLNSLGIDCEQVCLYWLSDKEGITVPFSLFVQHYDDLWYPSSDDLALTDNTGSWLLRLDHEEVFYLWQRNGSK